MAERVTNPEQLDKEKVQQAVEQFWEEAVTQTLRDRGLVNGSTQQEVKETVIEEPQQTTEWVKGFQEEQVIIPWVNTTAQPKKEEPKKVEPKKVEPVKQEIVETVEAPIDEGKKIQEFDELLASGGNAAQIKSFIKENPTLKASLWITYKKFLNNKQTREFTNKFSWADDTVLTDAVNSWAIVIGSKEYNSLDQQTRQRIQNINELITSTQKKDFTTDTTQIISFQDILSEMKSVFSSNVRSKIEEMNNNPELDTLRADMEGLQNEIWEIDDAIDFSLEDIQAQYPNLPRWAQQALLARKNRDLIRQKNSLVNQYNSKLGTYKDLKSDIQQEIELSKFEDALNREAYMTALNMYQTERARMDKFTMLQLEEESKLRAEQRQKDFQLQLIDIEQEWEAKNKKGIYEVDKEWNLLYIVDWVAQNVIEAEGKVVWITKTQDYQDNIVNLSDWSTKIIRTYDDWRRPDEWVLWVDWTNNFNVNMWAMDLISQVPNEDLQCWEFTDIYVAKGGLVSATTWETVDVQDSYESKKAFINNNVPQIGGLAVWNPQQEWPGWEYGHIWIVTWYNPETWEVEITDSNWKWDEKRSTHTVQMSEIINSDWWFVWMKKPWVSNNVSWQEQYSQSAIDWAINISRWQANIQNVPSDIRTEVSSALANYDITLDEDNPIVEWLRWQYDLAESIVDWETDKDGFFEFDTDNETIIESISWEIKFGPLEVWKGDILSKIQFLLDEQPLQKLIDVKAQWGTFGALSWPELALLTKSSSLLNSAAIRDKDWNLKWFNTSEATTKELLRNLRDWYKKAIERKTWVQYLSIDDIKSWLNEVWAWALDLSNSLDY